MFDARFVVGVTICLQISGIVPVASTIVLISNSFKVIRVPAAAPDTKQCRFLLRSSGPYSHADSDIQVSDCQSPPCAEFCTFATYRTLTPVVLRVRF